jgi:hypothetical protein
VSGCATSKKGSDVWGGGCEKRDVGASTTGCAGGRLGKQMGLTGGVRGPAREDTRWVASATGQAHRTTGGSGRASEGELALIGWPHWADGEKE